MEAHAAPARAVLKYFSAGDMGVLGAAILFLAREERGKRKKGRRMGKANKQTKQNKTKQNKTKLNKTKQTSYQATFAALGLRSSVFVFKKERRKGKERKGVVLGVQAEKKKTENEAHSRIIKIKTVE